MENAQIADGNEEEGDQNATPKVTGYPKLARMMSMSSETAILRRFGRLNMLNLLRLQAELHSLEHELQEIMEEDAASQDTIRVDYVNDFQLMRDFVEAGDSLYHDKLGEIGRKIEEYSKPLLRDIMNVISSLQTRLSNMPKSSRKLKCPPKGRSSSCRTGSSDLLWETTFSRIGSEPSGKTTTYQIW
jgi:hypothetical protein